MGSRRTNAYNRFYLITERSKSPAGESVYSSLDKMSIFKVTNIITGEEVEGTAREIFVKEGIFTNTIYQYSKSGKLYKGVWNIEKVK